MAEHKYHNSSFEGASRCQSVKAVIQASCEVHLSVWRTHTIRTVLLANIVTLIDRYSQ